MKGNNSKMTPQEMLNIVNYLKGDSDFIQANKF